MRKHGRKDANHDAVVDAARGAGCKVLSLAALGDGAPDLLVWAPLLGGPCQPPTAPARLLLVEVKDGSKPPSKRELTADQQRFCADWPVHVVLSPADMVALVRPRRVMHFFWGK